MTARIVGLDWEDIQRLQQGDNSVRNTVVITPDGMDYGADPLGDGNFRMVPSGDVVDMDERNRRLAIATKFTAEQRKTRRSYRP